MLGINSQIFSGHFAASMIWLLHLISASPGITLLARLPSCFLNAQRTSLTSSSLNLFSLTFCPAVLASSHIVSSICTSFRYQLKCGFPKNNSLTLQFKLGLHILCSHFTLSFSEFLSTLSYS